MGVHVFCGGGGAGLKNARENITITINFQAVQQQDNGVYCGLFALAFSTSLAFGDDPVSINYDKLMLRSHLTKCLYINNMTPGSLQVRIIPKKEHAKLKALI